MTFGAMRFAQLLFVIAAAIFFLLGVTHIALTIRDLYNPTSLTPTDDTVRQAMIDARLRLAPERPTPVWAYDSGLRFPPHCRHAARWRSSPRPS